MRFRTAVFFRVAAGALFFLTTAFLSAEVIRLGLNDTAESSWSPYIVVHPDLSFSGLSIDVLKAVVAVTGDVIQPVYLSPQRLYRGISNGDLDLDLISSPAWPEFSKGSVFTVPYMKIQDFLVFRKEKASLFKEKKDLLGKSVLLIAGFDYPDLHDDLSAGRILRVDAPDYDRLLQMLQGNRADAGIVDGLFFRDRTGPPHPDLVLGFPASGKIDVCMRFAPAKKAVAEKFDQVLEKLARDGTLSRIYAVYGPSDR